MSLYPMLARIKELIKENEELAEDNQCDDYEAIAYTSGKIRVLKQLLTEFTPINDSVP